MPKRTVAGSFSLLVWKNTLLQRRHPVQSLIEIGAPIVFSIILVVIRSLVKPMPFDQPIDYAPYNPVKLPFITSNNGTNLLAKWNVAWTPNHPALNEIMSKVAWSSGTNQIAFENEEEMLKNLTSESPSAASVPMLAGVIFDGVTNLADPLPNNIKIRLRFPAEKRYLGSFGVYDIPFPIVWFTGFLYPDYQIPGPRSNISNEGGPPGYSQEGFLALQNLISRSLIEYRLDQPLQNISIRMQRFSHPEYIDDPLIVALQSFVSLVIMLSFVYTSISCVRMVTTEKENQLKESMKIMGLPNWMHWTAWFLNFMSLLLIAIILMTALLKVDWYGTGLSVFTHSDASVIFVFLLLFAISTVTFSFLISVFFSKANTAATVAGVIYFLNYSVYYFLEENYNFLPTGSKVGASLLSNTAMAFGCRFIIEFEGAGSGVQWSNLFTPPSPDDGYTLGGIMGMLLLDAVLYMVLALYIEAIFPGDYGVPQPWYFPFTAEFWCGSKVDDELVPDNIDNSNPLFEPDPVDLYAGIQIKSLQKVFGRAKPAVSNVTMKMYEDQITVLLGHNGAGKTTTMSMLTGLLTPTSGTAVVGGFDIRKNIKKVRESLGLCPQHNILFDQLTVKEHLIFYCRLKGLSGKEVKSEVKKYIELLDFQTKKNSYSKTLSGGMKRKLSVGVALCGGSKVVMLDEPTSGMDPASRRTLWDFLEKEKKGRTLLLTTHFMDEADLLGDKIAIMASGKLQCYGSPFFLKKKYGTGYYLVIVQDGNCDIKGVTNLLRKYIPDVKVATNIGTELSFHLPEDKVGVFEGMLQEIEDHKRTLGVLSYGVSLSTMENVFVKAGRDVEVDEFEFGDKATNGLVKYDGKNSSETLFHETGSETRLELNPHHIYTGWKLTRNQFFAMMMKKALSQVQSWLLYFIQSILPAFFLIIVIIVAKALPGQENFPALDMSIGSYPLPITPVQLLSDQASVSLMYQKYLESLQDYRTDIVAPDMTMRDFILQKGRDDIVVYNMQYIAGATFDYDNETRRDSITAWFSNQPLHAAPLALDLVYNAIMKRYLGDEYSIQTNNHPLPYRSSTRVQLQLTGTLSKGFQYAFNVGFSMAFVSAFYVLFYVRERVTKSKHLQFVSGVQGWMYWFTAFLWDLFVFISPVGLVCIVFVSFQEEGLRTPEELGRLILVLYAFAWCVLPITYLTSFFFDVPSDGFSRLTILSTFLGVAAFMIVVILQTPELGLLDVANTLDWIFMLFPHYTVTMAVFNLYQTYLSIKVCAPLLDFCPIFADIGTPNACCKVPEQCPNGQCFPWTENYFDWGTTGIGRQLVYSFVEGAIALLILIVLEYHLFDDFIVFVKAKFLRYVLRVHPVRPEDKEEDDSDVAAEKAKLLNTDIDELNREYLLAMRNVSKYYGTFLAVDRLSIGIRKGECFGLLGVNGAGKTTTFKMLTGDEKISSGDAYLCGYSIISQMKEVHQIIGYCPQFDALLDDLTGRQTLTIFCLLRGIPYRECAENVDNLAKELLFTKHIDKQVKNYSGGNKRKLSTAVALIGDPPVLLLDEPTTGMDPVAKRHLWNVVCKARDLGKLVILTSHSMEECEALCTKLAIMVNGVFKCLGSTQHLKNKFAEGYSLIIKVTAESESSSHERIFNTQPAKDFVTQTFPSAELKENVQGMLSYYIRNPSIPWSRMFGIMERAKKTMNIEDYSIGQTSLEQVFLAFTKYQNPVPDE
ncbi:Hypothetical predicted protein [Cloeon dipterum]|nr:Hypothetical predicted protein [Cloeon dipterum]